MTDNHVKEDDDERSPRMFRRMSVPPCRLTMSATTPEDTANAENRSPFGIQPARAAFSSFCLTTAICRTYSEITGMLECENDNQRLESSFRQSTAVGSTWSAVRNAESGSNNIVWKTYMAFKELSLHVNEKVGSEGTAISNDLS